MLRLYTLGGLALERDGPPVGVIATRKVPLALLALLAGHAEHGISRDKVMAYLWPESDEAHARNSLKQALFALRRELGDTLLAPSPVLRLDPDSIDSDVAGFEACLAAGDHLAAAELYRGPFLDGFFVEDRDELERWVERERQRLHARYLEALTHLAKRAEAAPDPVAAALWWRRVAVAAPSSTRAALGVMRALIASGDRAAALEHARMHQSTLEVDLGLPPDEAVRELAETLRFHRPAPAPSEPVRQPATIPTSLPLVAAMVSSVPVAVPLVARRAPTVASAYLLPLFLTLALVGAVQLVSDDRTEPATPGLPATLTVLPFETLGESSDGDLGPGLGALLSSGLDGLEEYRAVPRGRLSGEAHPTGSAASAVARRSGARLYVTGRLVADKDSLRATASLWDRANADREVGRAEARAGRGELFALADQLVRELVADRARGPAERLAQVAAMSTRSLPALTAFLEGNRRLRADDYSAAIDAYSLAARADTGFGLAYYRLSVAADRAGQDEKAMWAAKLAARFSARLSEHDRRLVAAYLAAQMGKLDQAERLYRGILTDYPEDAEAWLRLGELLLHGNPLRGRSACEARVPFERVLALDPGQGDALVHLARVASIEGRRAEVDSLLARAEALAPSQGALDLRAVRSFALNDRPGQERATRDLLAQPALMPRRLALEVAVHLDDLDGTTRFAEILSAAPGTCDVRALGQRMLGQVAEARGQMQSAGHYFDEASPCDPGAALELHALMAGQAFVNPPDSELVELRRGLDDPAEATMEPAVRTYYAALIAIRLGDTVAAARAARSLQHTRDSTAAAALGRTLGHSLRARLHVAGRRTAAALAELEGAEWERAARLSVAEASDRYLRAELLRALGRTDEAIGWYRSIAERASYELVYLAPAELRLARIYDRRGDAVAARMHYGRFVELWRNADPELQPAVEEAEGRMVALVDGS